MMYRQSDPILETCCYVIRHAGVLIAVYIDDDCDESESPLKMDSFKAA